MPELTGEDKVAVLLSTLPPQTAETVLGRMAPVQAEKVRGRLKALGSPSPEALQQAAQELADIRRIAERPPVSSPPPEEPPVAAAETPAPPPAPQEEEPLPEDPADGLRQVDAEVLVAALKGERSSTVALVAGCLEVPQASALLKLMPAELRKEVALRLGEPSPLRPELADRVLRAVLIRCREQASQPAPPSPDKMLMRMADLVRALSREDRKEILTQLENKDPEAAAKVRKKLYTFDDLMKVDDRTMQTILGEFSTQTLALAIKGAPEAIKTKILNNVSRRAKDTIAEEMELLASASDAMIEAAQSEFTQVLQRLDEEGQVSL